MVDKDDVRKVAKIARINLSEEEIELFSKELDEIIKSFEVIGSEDIKEEPSFHPIKVEDKLRDDIPGECLSQEEALMNTKHKQDKLFKAPRVV